MPKMYMEVEVFDKDICKGCELFELHTKKDKNAYGDEIIEPKCKHTELCRMLAKRLNDRLLSID